MDNLENKEMVNQKVSTEVTAVTEVTEVTAATTETTVDATPSELAKVLNIKGIVTPGKRGVTNTQMIPVLKEAIVAKDSEKIAALKENYPKAFEGSIRYLGKVKKDLEGMAI